MKHKILLVEDDAHVCSFITKGLNEEGFSMTVAMNGNQGLQLAVDSEFDLIILDIMIPGINGLELCSEIRKKNCRIPILFLTALGSVENVVLGLNSGADDYLAKPFKFIELLARIKTLLRRQDLDDSSSYEVKDEIYTFQDLEVNDTTKTVTRAGHLIRLTSTEYRLLLMLIKNPRRVLSRTDILDEVWGINFNLGTNVVDVYVNYLRKKIDKYGERIVHTVVGMGYVLK